MSPSTGGHDFVVAEEELLRAQVYNLLAQMLAGPPAAGRLAALAMATGDDSEFGVAIQALADAARQSTAAGAEDEYNALFIGIGQGELVPFASYYRTGFLNEGPLADLRGDMARLGIARADTVNEPEDHIAALCEMMAGLITGAFDAPADLAGQRRFFDTHIGCWAPRFFLDLEAASSAVFYRPVGTLGRLFLKVESLAFDMAA